MNIITISGKAGSGKDTFGSFLTNQLEQDGCSVLVTHYADLLKYILKTWFGWDGVKDEAGRSLLQRVGTDVVRRQDPDYWVRFTCEMLSFFPHEWDFVIIPDARFPNEIDVMAKSFAVTALNIVRPASRALVGEQAAHISENALDGYSFDLEIINEGDLAALRTQAEVVARHLLKKE